MDDYRRGLGRMIPPMALDFFATFARFEFALKRGGFVVGPVGAGAEPHWDRFANLLGPAFLADMRAAPRASLFFTDPPKKLMIVGEQDIAFQRTADVVTNADLFVLVRRVRNNLFHGEKIFFGQRDERLVEAALFVLDAAFEIARHRPDFRHMTTAFAYAGINPH